MFLPPPSPDEVGYVRPLFAPRGLRGKALDRYVGGGHVHMAWRLVAGGIVGSPFH